jgi:formylglycine-generating enzyme required for sulfatase activity
MSDHQRIFLRDGVETMDPTFFAFLDGGTFLMGSPPGKSGTADECPQHEVMLDSFYMGRFQVTQKEYEQVMQRDPSHFKGPALPVEQVSWYDAIEYCNCLSKQKGLPPAYTVSRVKKDPDNKSQADELRWLVEWDAGSDGYRLPTEAEWEYAATGGAKTDRQYTYAGSDDPDRAGWYGGNSRGGTHPVGTKTPNILGLYDMSGNVWEWCWDWLGPYSADPQINPAGPLSGSCRVYRGGGWAFSPKHLRCVDRYGSHPSQSGNYAGFRIVRSCKQSEPM